MVSCRVHPGVIIPLGFPASEVPQSRADAGCHHEEVECTCERATSPQPRALKAHLSPRCRERLFGSLRSVKLFFGVFEKKERFLARRGSAIGLPCSAARRLSPSGPSACPRTRSARIHPIFVFEEKKEKKTRSPSCLFLFFRAHSPKSFPVALVSSRAEAEASSCLPVFLSSSSRRGAGPGERARAVFLLTLGSGPRPGYVLYQAECRSRGIGEGHPVGFWIC